MAAIGNLNDYVKFQMAESMTKGEGGALAGSAAQLGAGLAMGQQMAAAMAAGQSTPAASTSPAGGPAGAALPELLSTAEVAKTLGVSEADVMQSITDGSLKAKKIGSTYRISRVALDEFLKN